MSMRLFLNLLVLFWSAQLAARDSSIGLQEAVTMPKTGFEFFDPQKVTITGYIGDAQEPHISRDGSTLFFNNLNSPQLPGGEENDTNIHYAVAVDALTFQYMGEVSGANTDQVSMVNELEGVASADRNNQFYFVNTIDYLDSSSSNYLLSLFAADYENGSLSNIQGLPNLKSDRPPGAVPVPGELNFDAEIHFDGEVLYFVEGMFSGNPFPDVANISVAKKVDGIFSVDTVATNQLALVNTTNLEYAPSISTDQLELYFTRFTGSIATEFEFGIYLATRNCISEPWTNIQRLNAISGEFTEAPSISTDGQLLYYHQKTSDVFEIYVLRRETIFRDSFEYSECP